MLGSLTEKFQNIFSAIRSQKTLTEENISDAIREIRLALLDADVSYSVAKHFIGNVKEKSIGGSISKNVSAKDQFTKIIHDELVILMGSDEPSLKLDSRPSVVILCGLQGSGKTTQSAKLSLFLKKQNKKVMVAACDLQRPAAIDQLEVLCEKVKVDIFVDRKQKRPDKLARDALKKAAKENYDVLIVDTAGRVHLDNELMDELRNIRDRVKPSEILFVANAATGQDAVKTAKEFDDQIGITGSILTMLDGNTRAGAALSIKEITKKPLKFEGVGEKLTDLQLFNPRSMADRILGMGDIINLVKKAEEHFNEYDAAQLKKKFAKATFSFEDFLKQLRQLKKMGSMKSLLKMIPGFSNFGDIDFSGNELESIEAIILSMTRSERRGMEEMSPSRRRRIAEGSGRGVDEVNKMIKSFKRIKQFMKKMPGMKKKVLKESSLKEQIDALNKEKSSFGSFFQ